MAFDLTIINAALTRTGNPRITELNDGTPGGDIAGSNYDDFVLSTLSAYPWRWATKEATLTAIDGTLDGPWLYAYQLPSDLKHLSVVTVDGQPIDYEVQFTRLLCDVDTSYTIRAKYIWAVPEAYWPQEFAEYIRIALEAMFLRGIGERYSEAEARDKAAIRQLAAAKLADSKRRTARNPVTSPTLQARGAVSTSGLLLNTRIG